MRPCVCLPEGLVVHFTQGFVASMDDDFVVSLASFRALDLWCRLAHVNLLVPLVWLGDQPAIGLRLRIEKASRFRVRGGRQQVQTPKPQNPKTPVG